MTPFFQYARQNLEEEPEEAAPIFQESIKHKTQDIIPPVGISKPEILQSFLQNMDDENKIKESLSEAESFVRESGIESATRKGLAHVARAAEGFAGSLGSFFNFMLAPVFDEEEWEEREGGSPFSKFPTSEELREVTKKHTGKYLEPRSEEEKVTQEITNDIGSMFSVPGGGVLAKILLPVGGQAAKQTVKTFGGSESSQELGKLGFMVASSMAGIGNAPGVASNAYAQAKEMIPRGLSFIAKPTENAIKRIKGQSWYKTGSTPSKAPALHELQRIENTIKNGKIDGQTAMQLRVDINEARRQLGGFQLNQPMDKKGALRHLNEIDNALLESMKNYGEKVNPQWWKAYNQANEAIRVTRRSKAIADFMERYAKPLTSPTAKALFKIGGPTMLMHAPSTMAAVAPAVALGKSIQIINRMIRSPVLRTHYIDVLKQASKGNSAAMNKALEKFDKAASKHENIDVD